ncbi:MOSC domain-containing protein [Streptosporangium soli]|nr:MOSC N-terminal beta barrel domain-containing protein [Streptosporangium sp. KLBMP 9127]
MYQGTVDGLHRWPVKSLRGEELTVARLDGRGLAGDRAYALIDERPSHAGKRLTVRQTPGMLAWSAAYPATCDGSPEPPGPPVLYSADGVPWAWEDPGLPDALSEAYGVPLSLCAADGQQDRGPSVLVTFEASRQGLVAELGDEVDVLRFRPNVHLALDAPAFVEESFALGTTITVGEAVLKVRGAHSGPCIRCTVPSWDPHGRERWPELQKHLIVEHENKFGVIMRVTKPGVVRIGDPATIS